jgi:hypothetical protein
MVRIHLPPALSQVRTRDAVSAGLFSNQCEPPYRQAVSCSGTELVPAERLRPRRTPEKGRITPVSGPAGRWPARPGCAKSRRAPKPPQTGAKMKAASVVTVVPPRGRLR